MFAKYHQISLKESFSSCQDILIDDTLSFFQLLETLKTISHPEMPVEKKSDSPDEDESVGDSSCLKPILADFFGQHPGFHPDTFLGDSAFDTIDTYGFLRDEFHFSRALIPYNPRNESNLEKVGYNIYGYPTCPKDSNLNMKYAGHCHEKDRSDRDKWVCPKYNILC